MLTYIFITFMRNAYHIHGFSWNSLVYVFYTGLLVPAGARRGSSGEGLSSSSQCLLADLCFCANLGLGTPLLGPSGMPRSGLTATLQPPALPGSAALLSRGRAVRVRLVSSLYLTAYPVVPKEPSLGFNPSACSAWRREGCEGTLEMPLNICRGGSGGRGQTLSSGAQRQDKGPEKMPPNCAFWCPASLKTSWGFS